MSPRPSSRASQWSNDAQVRANGYRRFTATVGVNDSAREDCHFVTFTVYGDRKVLATSRPQQWGQESQQISVDISGVKIIALVARGHRRSRNSICDLGGSRIAVRFQRDGLVAGMMRFIEHAFAPSQANDDTLAGIGHSFDGVHRFESARAAAVSTEIFSFLSVFNDCVVTTIEPGDPVFFKSAVRSSQNYCS